MPHFVHLPCPTATTPYKSKFDYLRAFHVTEKAKVVSKNVFFHHFQRVRNNVPACIGSCDDIHLVYNSSPVQNRTNTTLTAHKRCLKLSLMQPAI